MTVSHSSVSISSPVFNHGQPIHAKYTCEAENISPPLAREGLTPGTNSLALILDDPDAPMRAWGHWVNYYIPPTQVRLSKNIPPSEQISGVGTHAKNSDNNLEYSGHCPPPGKSHHTFFKLFALILSPDQPSRMKSVLLNGWEHL
jgi:Raf kinase inhibitor-like YbhB/YbcL family protein